jgi:hypothetical protein
MTGTARVRLAIGIAAGVALFALVGCSRAAGTEASDSTLPWDAQALQAIGFTTGDLADPVTTVTQSAAPGKQNKARIITRHKLLRFAFGKRALHAEAVVQTDEGTKTVVVQRGTVTAVDATTVTVKSSDGFTLTWTFGDQVKVVKDGSNSSPSALTTGATVGVAGEKTGTTTTARLVVVPRTK